MLRAAAKPSGWPATARPGSGRQRRLPGRPDGGAAADAEHVMQIKLCHANPKVALVAIAGIAQHGAERHTILARLAELTKRDGGLGLKADRLRHSRLGPPQRIVGPG